MALIMHIDIQSVPPVKKAYYMYPIVETTDRNNVLVLLRDSVFRAPVTCYHIFMKHLLGEIQAFSDCNVGRYWPWYSYFCCIAATKLRPTDVINQTTMDPV